MELELGQGKGPDLLPTSSGLSPTTPARLSPRVIWIRVSRETELSCSGGLRGLALEWRHVGSQQPGPGPTGPVASEPWGLARSRQLLSLSDPI